MLSRPLVFMLMHAIAASACAQAPDHEQRRPPPPAEVARQLGLDANKTPQFMQILEDQRNKMDALREMREENRDAMHQKMEAVREETRHRLEQLLDADQLARFEALRPKPAGPPPDNAGHGAPPPKRQG